MNTAAPLWLEKAVFGAVAEVTGHATDDLSREQFLESDLGLDSIKTVELMNAILPHLPEHIREVFHQALAGGQLLTVQTLGELEDCIAGLDPRHHGQARPVAATAGGCDPGMTQRVYGIVAGITGHDARDLSADMFLESDLGLDSIKTVELMNALAAVIPPERQPEFMEKLGNGELFGVQTLQELLDLMGGGSVAVATSAPVAASSAPVAPAAIPMPPSSTTVTIAFSQYPFLVSHWAVCCCSLSSGLRLKGRFDAELGRKVWDALLARHPMLRARFAIPHDARGFKDYRLEVLDGVEAQQLTVTDLRHLDGGAQEALLAEETHRQLNREWPLEQWPVHGFSAFRLAEDEYEVMFANHHIFSDGLSNQQIMREFAVLYAAFAAGQPAMLPPATLLGEYQQTVERISQWSDAATEKALEQFLQSQGKGRFFWDPDKKGPPTHARADNRTYRFHAAPEATATLLQATGRWRLPVNTLLAGAYLKGLSRFANGLDKVILNIPTSGRVYPGLDAAHQIGCFAQNLALTLPLPAVGETWESYLPRLHEVIEGAIAAGYDRAQTRQAALAAASQLPLQQGRVGEPHATFIRSTIKSNLYLPYIGQTRIEEACGPLRVVDYHAATSTNPGTLDVLVEVFQGRFNMAANYDGAYFPVELIAEVAGEFVRQIDDLARASAALPESFGSMSVAVDAELAQKLLTAAGETLRRTLDQAALDLDLEADLGMDSLERIRVVGRLRQHHPAADTRALLGCRSLREMAGLLKPQPSPQAVFMQALPPIPYLHVVERCHRHPEAIAVADGTRTLSYGRLNAEANRLAHYLRGRGVGPGILVGLMLPRSPEFAIAVLAVLKAGGAYVPVDSAYPASRIEYMLGHSRIGILITEQALESALAEVSLSLHEILLTDVAETAPASRRLGRAAWAGQPDTDPDCRNNPDDLMVVLYTSGSTGTPKGVALAHRGYMNRMDWHQELFRLEMGERVAQKTSICFDISVWELFWPLLNGGTICPAAPELLRDPWRLADWMEAERIAVMHFVPSLFNEFLIALEGPARRFESLRWLIFSGEALPVSQVQRWFERQGPRVGMANLYGPTEASIDVTAHLMHAPPIGSLRIPIGPAMPHVHLLVLDEAMRPLTTGSVGELWIGGIQLAQGYLFDEARTAENFRANPFPQIPGPFLYRTGDLALRLPDGSFEYHGRIDNQVKIRGFRVELGEVEAAIDALPGVSENAVLVQDMGDGNQSNQRLVAWIVGRELPLPELRALLSRRLPEYMLPQQVFHADALPKNHNGKLDRKVLKQWTEAGRADALPAGFGAAMPLAPAQAWITRFFDPPYRWAGYTRHRYLKPLDIDVFQRALNLLAERHPVLRSVFTEVNGRLQPTPAPRDAQFTVEVYDGGHLDDARRDEEIRQLVCDKLEQLRIDRFPLWQVLVIKSSRGDAYDIAVIGHHMISDLVSNGILFREAWHIYGQLLLKQTPELPNTPPSFQDYVACLHDAKAQASRAAYVDYWRRQFSGLGQTLRVPFDHQLGANDEASSAKERFVLRKPEFRALNEARQHFQSQIYPLLLAPAYRLLSEWSGQARVTLSHRSHGRDLGDGRTFFETVGNFAVNYPVPVELMAGESWRVSVDKIAKAFAEVPLNGVSYDWVGGELPEAIYPDNKLTPVRVNYLGNRSLPKSEIFTFDEDDWDQRYASPNQKRTALIEIFLSTVDGELRIDIDYSRNFFAAASIQCLGRRYLELLAELIDSSRAQPTLRLVSGHLGEPAARTEERPARVALVTGASRGIGRAIALRLASQGTAVVLMARKQTELEAVVREIVGNGGTAVALSADVTDADQVQAVVDEALRRFGKIDVLVNNAGITGMSSLINADPDDWKRIVEVNLFGTYHVCRAVAPQMMNRRGGKIINLGSDSSFIGYPLFSAYAASKHGVLGLTRSLAEELKPHNIQVNSVCPAFVDTDMTPAAFRARAIPVDAVADAVVFLASEQADWITGEAVNLYGRQDMYWFGAEKMGGLETIAGLTKAERNKEGQYV